MVKVEYNGAWDMPFTQAIAQATQRGVVLPDIYYGQLQGLARQKAFSIAGITSLDTLQAVKESLDKVIAEGGTFGAWKKQMLESGTLSLPKHRLDNIYRTNLQGSYMAGIWDRVLETKTTLPYLLYDAINDSRVRPSHLALDGIIRRIDDNFWKIYSPPNGYRCRCRIRALTERDALARSGQGKGLNQQPVLEDGTPALPDKGWDYNPSDRLSGIERALVDKRSKSSNVLFSALSDKTTQDMKIITLEGFDAVQAAMLKIAEDKPGWFPQGFNGIYAVSNPEIFAGFDTETSSIYMSTASELAPGFSPAHELQGALEKIKSGEKLSFNNEYAVETLWHEMIHGITRIKATRFELGKDSLEEGVVQSISRLSYYQLLNALGKKAEHQDRILVNGYAYPNTARNIITMLELAKLDKETIVDLFLKHKELWKDPFAEELSVALNIKKDRIRTLYGHAVGKPVNDFKEKIAVLIRNAPRNSHE